MLTGNQIPALYNGISQQPATLRSPTQAEEQVNGWATIVDGLQKRSPSELIAKLDVAVPSGAFLHDINRDTTERYVVVVTDGDLKVFNMLGEEQAVIFTNGKGYLDVPDGKSTKTSFALATVADYTFVVNREVVVELEAAGADLGEQPSYHYQLNRPNEGDATGAQKIQYPPNPVTNMSWNKFQSFQDLPQLNTVGAGALGEITGNDQSGFTTYYVYTDGTSWNEVVRPGLRNLFKATTMPHALVRIAPGVFEFGPFSWAPRRVGDEYTNPHPTFVGRKIRDVFFYKNRLGFCCDENAVLSRAGDFGVFHRMTVLDLLADDYIDVAASDVKVTKFNFAVPFANSMMLFSDQVQFRLNHMQIVSPGTMSLDVTTQYEMSTTVRPAVNGSDVYFVGENGSWASLREYYVRDDTTLTDAADLTAHAPRYIPAGVTKLITSTEHDAIFVLTDGAPNRIYVYKFYWANADEKAQSAWSYWEMAPSDVIMSGTLLDNYLHLVIKRGDGVYLERLPLDSGVKCPGYDYQVYLDRRTEVTGLYFDATFKTRFTLPYAIPVDERDKLRLVFKAKPEVTHGNSGITGALISPSIMTWVDDLTVEVAGNYEGTALAGYAYDFRYTFSEQFMKTQNGIPLTTGALQLRTFTLYYTGTAFFRTEVAPYGYDPDTETVVPAKYAEFSGKTIGDAALTIGEPAFHTGSYTFQIYGNSDVAKITISNDSHLASNFQNCEWEGFYQNRARFR